MSNNAAHTPLLYIHGAMLGDSLVGCNRGKLVRDPWYTRFDPALPWFQCHSHGADFNPFRCMVIPSGCRITFGFYNIYRQVGKLQTVNIASQINDWVQNATTDPSFNPYRKYKLYYTNFDQFLLCITHRTLA
jgi:hypothetical protein